MKKYDFLDEMEYIDGITIINEAGTILFSVKFNPDLNPKATKEDEIIGKKLSEVFTNLSEESSTLMTSIALEKIIRTRKQLLYNFNGTFEDTMNISIPIKSNNKVVGSIELSKSLLPDKLENAQYRKLKPEIFKKSKGIETFASNRAHYTLDDIITCSDKILEIKRQIELSSQSSSSVFIYGETGTGKELFAHSIHNASSRRDMPFIPINCAAIPEGLLESILFGTKKGSFTGAVDAEGLFEVAEGGTIFLDELNTMPISLQSKLLRVLEDGRVRRIGGTEEKDFNVRIISSSNVPIQECINNGTIRKDIYYRLCVFNITIPPLRERKEDIELLFNYFVDKLNTYLNKNVEGLSNEAYQLLRGYDWPGNARELRHLTEYVMNLIDPNEKIIDVQHFRDKINELKSIDNHVSDNTAQVSALVPQLESLEIKIIEAALNKHNGNITRAASDLDLPRQTLQNKIKKYEINL
ncbi:MAG: sigma 54-interacting transcriptional regulator [Synergistaceae bacterium]|nr:sigma 54-interacting transcriptional regulator [Synergistaceae bacterium]